MLIYTYTKAPKPKRKPKAEREQYEQWLAKHNVTGKKSKPKFVPLEYKLEIPRKTTEYKSLNPTNMAPAPRREKNVYTGDKMLGIGTLHKSNAVPVFSAEDATDIARMRR
jgi:hypothetical protein